MGAKDSQPLTRLEMKRGIGHDKGLATRCRDAGGLDREYLGRGWQCHGCGFWWDERQQPSEAVPGLASLGEALPASDGHLDGSQGSGCEYGRGDNDAARGVTLNDEDGTHGEHGGLD